VRGTQRKARSGSDPEVGSPRKSRRRSPTARTPEEVEHESMCTVRRVRAGDGSLSGNGGRRTGRVETSRGARRSAAVKRKVSGRAAAQAEDRQSSSQTTTFWKEIGLGPPAADCRRALRAGRCRRDQQEAPTRRQTSLTMFRGGRSPWECQTRGSPVLGERLDPLKGGSCFHASTSTGSCEGEGIPMVSARTRSSAAGWRR